MLRVTPAKAFPAYLFGYHGASAPTATILDEAASPVAASVPGAVLRDGISSAPLVAPEDPGLYLIEWTDSDGTELAVEELEVVASLTTGPGGGPSVYPAIAGMRDLAEKVDRVIVGRPATLAVDLRATPDADSVNVTVVGDSGAVFFDGEPSSVTGAAASVDLSAAALDRVDLLTALWTFTVDGDAEWTVTSCEVAGSWLVSIADARKLDPLDAEDAYPDADVLTAAKAAEDELEDVCGRSFVRRYGIAEGSGVQVRLPRPALALRLVRVDGVNLTDDDLARLTLVGTLLVFPSDLAGRQVHVGYEHGHQRPGANRAAALLTRMRLTARDLDDRRLSIPTEAGMTIPLATPGVRGSFFGLPEVDAFVKRARRRALVA